ncbi:MAG: hypothetical protein ACR2PX_04255, partial [Endozoicomonas sp.]|uniref:hypothetical protein n=1 Tax=Endozoicomonas sp. TaxID=1892382 RepID=UPI003D9BA4B1
MGMSLTRRELIQKILIFSSLSAIQAQLLATELKSMFHLPKVHSIDDLRDLAKVNLTSGVFDYIEGCPADCLTKKANSDDFRSIRLKPAALPGIKVGRFAATFCPVQPSNLWEIPVIFFCLSLLTLIPRTAKDR